MNWSKAANTAKLYLGLGTEEEYLQGAGTRQGPATNECRRTKRLNFIATLMLVVGIVALLMFVDSLAWQITGVAVLVTATTALSALFHKRSTPPAGSG